MLISTCFYLIAAIFVSCPLVHGQTLVFDQASLVFTDPVVAPKVLKVKLSAQPAGSLLTIINYSGVPYGFSVSPCSLTLTRTNWNVEQSVSVKPYQFTLVLY